MSSAFEPKAPAHHLAAAASVVSGATFVSRVLGYIRDMLIAYGFGAGLAADAFFVAFRIPNMARELFGEGALSAAFIPVFTETLTKRGRPSAFRLAATAFWIVAVMLSVVCAVGIRYVSAPPSFRWRTIIFSPSWKKSPPTWPTLPAGSAVSRHRRHGCDKCSTWPRCPRECGNWG